MYIVYNVYVAHWGIQDCGEQRRLKKLLVERTLKYKHYILCVSTAIVQYHYILPYKHSIICTMEMQLQICKCKT